MKRKIIIGLSVLVVLGFVAVISVNATVEYNKTKELQSVITKLDKLLTESEAEVSLEEMSGLMDTMDSYLNDANIKAIKTTLKNEDISESAKQILVEAIGEKIDSYEQAEIEDLCELILEQEVDSNLRISLLNAMPTDNKKCKQIVEQVLQENKDDILVSHALKKQYEYDAEQSINMAFNRVTNRENESEEVLYSALYVISSGVKEKRADGDQAIQACQDIIENEDGSVAEAAGYALGDMCDMDALKVLLDSDLDELVKIGCVEQNYATFLSCLSDNPSDEQIDTMIKAMNIYPITEVVDILKDVLKDDPERLSQLDYQDTFQGNTKKLNGESVEEFMQE